MAAPRRVNLLDRPPPADTKSPLVKLAAAPTVTNGIEIETGIPIPETVNRQSVTDRMPFDQLEIGQSFVVPGPSSAKNAFFWVKRAQKQFPGKYFVSRRIPNGVRIWRVEAAKK